MAARIRLFVNMFYVAQTRTFLRALLVIRNSLYDVIL